MSSQLHKLPVDNRIVKVWVLAPYIESADANIDYYCDFTQSISEYEKTFAELSLPWKWQPNTLENYRSVVAEIAKEKAEGNFFPIVLNICDGDEINGTPGISVLKELELANLVYTGSDEYFYRVTTSKIPMKRAFDEKSVATPAWLPVYHADQDVNDFFDQLGSPLIIKPSVSGGSMGIGVKNVVYDESALKQQVSKLFEGYRNWNLVGDGLIAESFINGPEFTTLICGSYDRPENAIVYAPVERVFHPSLPDHQKFLSFDRLWEIYEEESPMPNDAHFYEYKQPDEKWIPMIKQISWDAFVSTRGKGYTRVDIRQDAATGKLYVLEVNAQCGLSEDENYTSIGAILRYSKVSFSELILQIINDALLTFNAKTAAV